MTWQSIHSVIVRCDRKKVNWMRNILYPEVHFSRCKLSRSWRFRSRRVMVNAGDVWLRRKCQASLGWTKRNSICYIGDNKLQINRNGAWSRELYRRQQTRRNAYNAMAQAFGTAHWSLEQNVLYFLNCTTHSTSLETLWSSYQHEEILLNLVY